MRLLKKKERLPQIEGEASSFCILKAIGAAGDPDLMFFSTSRFFELSLGNAKEICLFLPKAVFFGGKSTQGSKKSR